MFVLTQGIFKSKMAAFKSSINKIAAKQAGQCYLIRKLAECGI